MNMFLFAAIFITFLLFAHNTMAFFVERECRKRQINFYSTNHASFCGEQSSISLKDALLKCNEKVSNADSQQDLLLDVGANSAQSYSFLRALSPNGLVLMFEPNPDSVAALRKKFETDRNAKIFATAIGETNGSVVYFNLQHATNWAGNEHGSLAQNNVYEDNLSNKVSVPLSSLDALLYEEMIRSNKRGVKFLKVDTEGFDQLVFYGAAKLLADVEIILWECHELQRESKGGPGTTLYESVDFLEKHDFHTFLVGPSLMRLDGGLYHPHYDTLLQWQNCFSIKKNHKLAGCVDKLLLPMCKLQ